jgi:hypothetical protein
MLHFRFLEQHLLSLLMLLPKDFVVTMPLSQLVPLVAPQRLPLLCLLLELGFWQLQLELFPVAVLSSFFGLTSESAVGSHS